MRAKMTPNVLQEAVLGKRWTQPELLASGIAHEVVDADKLLDRAVEVGEEQAPKVALGAWGAIKVGHICLGVSDLRNRCTKTLRTRWLERRLCIIRKRRTRHSGCA